MTFPHESAGLSLDRTFCVPGNSTRTNSNIKVSGRRFEFFSIEQPLVKYEVENNSERVAIV